MISMLDDFAIRGVVTQSHLMESHGSENFVATTLSNVTTAVHGKGSVPKKGGWYRTSADPYVYCGRTGPAVDQGDLAEVLTRAEGSEVDAFARNLSLSRGDDEEGGAARPLHDDGLALCKAPFLEQTGDLLGLAT
ncbi:hypothetical protein V1289_004817 [Bradyrhizobium sp. AZCC 2289]